MGKQADGITNEAAALTDILSWSADLPAWQRDALRRLCASNTLDQTAIDELLEICKGNSAATPLGKDHLRDPAGGTAVVTLTALHGLSNVNALAPGERLSFGNSGLTVIYGDNGAGKSGYARVLKQLCRARSPKGDTILPNIYADAKGEPSAKIDFRIGAQNRSASWTQGSAADPMLSAVSVFDSRTANVHVENTNELAYTPMPLQILAGLAQVCQDLKAELSADIRRLEEQIPQIISEPTCQDTTSVGRLLRSLSPKTKDEDVKALAGLTEAEETKLQSLDADLGGDPARTIRLLEQQSKRVAETQNAAETLSNAVDDQSWHDLHKAYVSLTNAQAAAKAASENLFADDPLPDIGSEVWKALWIAARNYSEQSAYPDKDFPTTDPGDLCVLCHQPLNPDAANRMRRFEAFVQDESKRREEDARTAYDEAVQAFAEKRLSIRSLRAFIAFVRDDLGKEDLSKALRYSLVQTQWRARSILRTHRLQALPALPKPSVLPIDEIKALKQEIDDRITALKADSASPERVALIAERDELADRKWLSTIKDDVIVQIDRLKSIAALRAAVKDTATNKITTQSARIATALVTNRLRGQFAVEVDKLGVAGLAIELQQAKTSAGVPFFQVRLINKPSEPVGKVLSEGEHRCVALAAFLAELSTIEAQSAIVFDDPVSSLDHLHRDKVAERLAAVGQSRQVIVFTHDLAFLLLLSEACKATVNAPATPIAYRLVSKGADNAGFCHAEPPASVLPLDNVIAGMKTHLGNVKIHHQRGDQANWLREVTSFQDQLRTSWERAVEDVISPVVKRLSRKVDTTGMIKLSVLTKADHEAIRAAYGRCSALLHSQPGEINPKLPTPDQIETEIHALEAWLADVKSRQNAAG